MARKEQINIHAQGYPFGSECFSLAKPSKQKQTVSIMCGIAGFYNFDGVQDANSSHAIGIAMRDSLSHRGPDSAGIWKDAEFPVVLSHRRLAIVDLSPDGAQPMESPSGRYMCVYNGEIYNYRDLKIELSEAGQVFKTRSDTEVMLAAIDMWGLDHTLQKLNGMFAIALWDRRDKKIIFARDRFGKKPLYVGWAGKNLVFASELKAFHAHPDFTPDISKDVLGEYMRFGYVRAPNCIFKKIWQMRPASVLMVDCKTSSTGFDLSSQMKSYWSLSDVVKKGRSNLVQGSESDIVHDFEHRLSLATKRRMDCDVPFGSFLSGGIDSSLVTALMRNHSTHPIKTYSIGFEDKGYDESIYAAQVAKHLGTDHHEFKLGAQDVLSVIPKLADIYDEPFADMSQMPTYLISKMARAHVTVALTGDGGDEIMGGYQRHTHIPPLWKKIGWMPQGVRQGLAKVMLSLPQSGYDRMYPRYAQLGRRVHRMAGVMAARGAGDIYPRLLEVWPAQDGVVMGQSPCTDNDSYINPDLSLSEQMMMADLMSYRPDDLMVKMDRASMAVALEARAPLMDYELCEYSWRLPMEYKIRGIEGKWLLRRILEQYVPRDLIDRPKTGFGVPIQDWLKGPLKSWGDDLLSEDRLKKQNILNVSLVAGRWKDFQDGKTGHANTSDIWTALMFQSWHDRWMK